MKFKKTTIIAVLFFGIGLIFRITNLSSIGHYFDIIITQAEWGKNAHEMGILDFWRDYTGYFDYMPLSVVFERFIYLLGSRFGDPYLAFNIILKLFNLFTDLLISWLIISLPSLIQIDKPVSFSKRLLISSIFFATSYIGFVSNIWGQNDSLIALFVLLSLIVFYCNNFNLHIQAVLSGFLVSTGFWFKQQAILAIPAISVFFLFQKKLTSYSIFAISILISTIFSIAPFYSTNSDRTIEVLFTVANRDSTTTNGANNLWTLINKVGDSTQLELLGISIDTVSKILLALFGLITIFIFSKKYWRYFTKNISLPLDSLLHLTLIFNTIYFYFGTKMHSRYLHIGLVCGFVLLVFPKFYRNIKFIIAFSLLNLGYFINQVTTYTDNPDNVEPIWVSTILQPFNIDFLDQSSSFLLLLGLILLLFNLFKQIKD